MDGLELRRRREKLGYNRVQFAKRIKTPYDTLKEWEYGNNRIPGLLEVALELIEKEENGRNTCK